MLDGPAREALREQGVLSTYQHFLNNGFIFDTTFCSLNSKLVKNRSSWPFPSISKVGWAYLTFPCLYQSAGNDSFLGVWKWKWNEIPLCQSSVRCLYIPNEKWKWKGSSAGKESACSAGDPGSIFGSGRAAGEGEGYPLPYSWTSLAAQLVKNPSAMRETCVWSLS